MSSIFGSSESAIGIDIGSSSIKVVQLKKEKGTIRLETYGALALGPYADKIVGQATDLDTDTLANALTDLLEEANTSTVNGGIAIPFHSTLMSVIELPNVGEEEMAKMVPIEAKKHIPVSMNDVSLDWSVVPGSEREQDGGEESDAATKVDVLTVAVHNSALQKYRRIVQSAELNALFFEVEIFSTIRSVVPQQQEPVLIVDVGAASTKLYAIEHGTVRGSHTINEGSHNMTEAIATSLQVDDETAEVLKRGMQPEGETRDRSDEVASAVEPVLGRILSETVQFQRDFEQKYDKEISKLVFVGGGAQLDGIREAASRYCDVPVELGNPFEQIKTPSFLEETLAETGPEFAVATGIALRKLRSS